MNPLKERLIEMSFCKHKPVIMICVKINYRDYWRVEVHKLFVG
jgi:hypothetical protein